MHDWLAACMHKLQELCIQATAGNITKYLHQTSMPAMHDLACASGIITPAMTGHKCELSAFTTSLERLHSHGHPNRKVLGFAPLYT